MESMVNHIFMVTLTYNNEMIPSLEVNEHEILYADHNDVIHMFKRLKRYNLLKYPFRYFGVQELGKKRGRPHFHLLILIPKQYLPTYAEILDYETYLRSTLLAHWSRNIGNNRKPVYKPLCTYVRKFIAGKWRSNYDCHYVNPQNSSDGIADSAFYVTKYMLKRSDREIRLQQALRLNLSESEYEFIWQTVRSRSFYSTGYGLSPSQEGKNTIQEIRPNEKIVSYLRDSVRRSIRAGTPFPCFYNPLNGNTFPLARYYMGKHEIYTLSDAYEFYFINNPDLQDPLYLADSLAYSEMMARLQRFEKQKENLNYSNDDYLYELCQ